MNKDELEKTLDKIRPTITPFGCKLSVDSIDGDEIKLKMDCPPLDMFKVQGKTVSMQDEFKKKIIDRIQTGYASAKVTFIQ